MEDFGLYIVISKPVLSYDKFCEICVSEGVPMLQLREKNLCDKELVSLARKLKDICKGSATLFFINDRADLALYADADGLHLGPDDCPWQEAANLIKPDKLLGVSTHNREQVRKLINDCKSKSLNFMPDYMSFGPVWPTPTKEKADPPVGTGKLKEVMSIAPLPVVAIGGIFPHNLEEVLRTGAKNVAMVRHFAESRAPNELKTKIRQIKAILKEKS